jgi:hypothetical protein
MLSNLVEELMNICPFGVSMAIKPTSPDFASTYLFKKLLPISLPFYNPALNFTKTMYIIGYTKPQAGFARQFGVGNG